MRLLKFKVPPLGKIGQALPVRLPALITMQIKVSPLRLPEEAEWLLFSSPVFLSQDANLGELTSFTLHS